MKHITAYRGYSLAVFAASLVVLAVAESLLSGTDLHELAASSLVGACVALAALALTFPRLLGRVRTGCFPHVRYAALIMVAAACGGALYVAQALAAGEVAGAGAGVDIGDAASAAAGAIATDAIGGAGEVAGADISAAGGAGASDVTGAGELAYSGELSLAARVALAVAICLLTAVGEEGVFRGVLVPMCMRLAGHGGPARVSPVRMSPEAWRADLLKACVASALAFGIVHVDGSLDGGALGADGLSHEQALAALHALLKVVQAALFGFCMAALLAKTGSIWPAVGMHAVFDLLYLGPEMVLSGQLRATYVTASEADMLVLAITIVLFLPPCAKSLRWLRHEVLPYNSFSECLYGNEKKEEERT